MQKVALVILDGFGINENTLDENAIKLANTPNFDYLFSSKYAHIDASGLSVGVPAGQMGNSEIGHLTIGSGRIIEQSIVKIDNLLDKGDFENILEYKKLIAHCKKNNSKLHIMQLFGPGGVHSNDTHLNKFLKIIPNDIEIRLHLFGDGRDLAPDSMLGLFEKFQNFLQNHPNIKISSISGRYFAMDRDNNWDRIKLAYDELVIGKNIVNISSYDYIKASYENGIYDEFLKPVSFEGIEKIDSGDGLVFLNFRADRAKQLTKAFAESNFEYFDRLNLQDLYFVTMMKYYDNYKGDYFVKETDISNTLGEIISKNGFKQLHLAETEKFAHVTNFFNGGKTIVYDGETDILVPSHKVATYDLDPEMSAQEIFDEFEKNAKNFDFTIVNFANGDMVGHTGKMQSAIKSVEKLDSIVGNIISYSKEFNIDLIITADHGNCEEMGSLENPKTAHTTNPVPCWHIRYGKVMNINESGGLADIAPTILRIMNADIPSDMTGNSLI